MTHAFGKVQRRVGNYMEGFHSPPNTEKNCVVNSFDVMAYQDMNIYIYIYIHISYNDIHIP